MRYLAAFMLAAALPTAAFAFQADFNWSGTLSPGQTIRIKGVNGSIHAELAASNIVEVTAHKTATRSDPASVRIEVVPSSDGVTICSVYPNVDNSEPNSCEPGKGHHSNTRDNDVVVDFTVKVPASIALAAGTVNGQVIATGLRSDVAASSVNGNVKVTTSGIAHASSVNGSIDATMGTATWSGGLAFSTVNGSIDLTLPAAVSAEIHASSVSGEMASDFPMTVSGKFGGRSMIGRIGSGGRDLHLSTVNGAITLHQGAM